MFATVEQGGTLLDLLKLLTDETIRERMVTRIQDVVRSFWVNEFSVWSNQYRTEAVSSVTNKIMPFLTNRHLRAITSGTSKSSLNLRQIMDQEQILIINISRGRLGQDNATLLGSLGSISCPKHTSSLMRDVKIGHTASCGEPRRAVWGSVRLPDQGSGGT